MALLHSGAARSHETIQRAGAVALTPAIAGQDVGSRSVVRAYFRDIALARSIAHSRFETLESKYELGYVVVNANAEEQRELRALGFSLQADAKWQNRQLALARSEEQAAKQRRLRSAGAPQPSFVGIPNYSCYPTVEEVFAEGDALIAARPDLARWVDIGDSWQKTQNQGGYDLRVLRLSNAAYPSGKPKLFINAGIHAREYATTPLVLEFAKRLVHGHGVDPDMTWILDQHEIPPAAGHQPRWPQKGRDRPALAQEHQHRLLRRHQQQPRRRPEPQLRFWLVQHGQRFERQCLLRHLPRPQRRLRARNAGRRGLHPPPLARPPWHRPRRPGAAGCQRHPPGHPQPRPPVALALGHERHTGAQ